MTKKKKDDIFFRQFMAAVLFRLEEKLVKMKREIF